MRTVARLAVTPVKGTALHFPHSVHVESYGVAENRRFFLIDEEGKLTSGAKVASLVQIHAAYEPDREHLALRFPNGTVTEGTAVADGDVVEVNFWGRPVTGRTLDGPWSAALSAFAGRPLRLVRAEHYGGGTDVRPLTLVSTASTEELSRQAGVDNADVRRFRMLIEIAGCTPHEEDAWQGSSLRIGDAVVEVGSPVPRCVVTTHSPDTGAKDLETLKVIRGYRGRSPDNELIFGVYGDVREPGAIRVGDPVEIIEETSA